MSLHRRRTTVSCFTELLANSQERNRQKVSDPEERAISRLEKEVTDVNRELREKEGEMEELLLELEKLGIVNLDPQFHLDQADLL
mmetsp:Transcript_7834/g.7079  ORF Transcript_7834/g.7079 Transcript_7834/m.7079 type:complete len:85 (-) Transcript_7834:1597-1851(-)